MTEPQQGYSRAYVWYAMGVVFLVAMFNVIDRTIISMLVPGIKADLGLDDEQMGFLMGPAFAVVHFLAVLPAAWLADRTVRRTVIASALSVWSAMTALGGAAVGFWTLCLTRMGVGLGEAGGAPPSVSLLSDTAPQSMRARALSALTIGSLMGIGVGLIAGGYLAGPLGWRGTLVAVGLPGLAIALLVRFTLREPPRTKAPTATPLEAARHLFSLPSFRWMLLAAVLAGVGSMGRSMWEPEFIRRVYGYDGLSVGVTVFVYGAVPSAVGAYLGSAIADRLRSRDERWPLWVCAIGNLLSTPPLLLFLLLPATAMIAGLPAAFWAWILGGVLIGFFSAPMGAMAQNLARPNMRALAHAIWTMIFTGIGQGAGPYLVGVLTEAWRPAYGDESLRYAMAATGLAVAASGVVYLIAAQRVPADLELLRRSEN
jgi:MFS family permease